MAALLNGMIDVNGSVCLAKAYTFNSYNSINDITGVTSYTGNTGTRVVIYKNNNQLFQVDINDEAICLNVTGQTMSNWYNNYLNSLVTTGYTGYTINGETGIEERIIHNNGDYYRIDHIENSNICTGSTTPKWAIIDPETNTLWSTSSGRNFFYYEMDNCGLRTGRMFVIQMDINPFSNTYTTTQNIKRPVSGETSPIIFTNSAVITIPATGVTFSGTINSLGNNTIISKGFCYGVFSNPTIEDLTTTSTGSITFTSPVVSGLITGNTYYVRAYAVYYNNNIGSNIQKIEYGTEKMFNI